MCAAKIASRRGEELAQVLRWAVDQGHTVGMLTLTARHNAGQVLQETWDAVQRGWRRMTSGRTWQAIKAAWELMGWARAFEVTHGGNGWHPHIHAIVILEGDQGRAAFDKLGETLLPRWLECLRKSGYDCNEHGLDIQTSAEDDPDRQDPARYLVKALAMEATGSYAKDGKLGGRAPFQILADVVKNGDADDLDLWHEYERASKGRRQLTWSRDLREMAGLAEEQSDEEIAAETLDGDDALMIERETWREVAPIQGELLVAAEAFGVAGARAWMRRRGFTWREPSAPERELLRGRQPESSCAGPESGAGDCECPGLPFHG